MSFEKEKDKGFVDLDEIAPGVVPTTVIGGATPRMLASLLAGLSCVVLGILCGSSIFIAFVDPKENALEYSSTLIVLCIISIMIFLYGVHDVYKTARGLLKEKHVSWQFQQGIFVRAIVPLIVHLLIVFPFVLTFVYHSQNRIFFNNLTNFEDEIVMLEIFHITVSVINFLSGVPIPPYVHYTLKLGHFEKEDKSFGFCATKLSTTIYFLSTIVLIISLIYSMSALRINSAVITFSILYIIMSLLMIPNQMKFLFMRSEHFNQNWLIVFRAVTALHLGILYLTFWVVLMMLGLENASTQIETPGFWSEVAQLPPRKAAAVYIHFAACLALLASTGARVVLAKLRKKDRAPKVLRGAVVPQSTLLKHQMQSQANLLERNEKTLGLSN